MKHKTTTRDYTCAVYCRAHNVGAGGIGYGYNISFKRIMQMDNRGRARIGLGKFTGGVKS